MQGSENQELRWKYKGEKAKSAKLSLQLRYEQFKSSQLEAQITRLKSQHEEELMSIRKSNEEFFSQILEDATPMSGAQCGGLAAQLHTASVVDTGSSSEFRGASRARLVEVEADEGNAQHFAEHLANLFAEPLAPDPQFIDQPELFQQQLHSVVPQLHLLSKSLASDNRSLPVNSPPGLVATDKHCIEMTTESEHSAKRSESQQQASLQAASSHQNPFLDPSAQPASNVLAESTPDEFWDTDCQLLAQMEAREAKESGADNHNHETFGTLPDNQSQCSEGTDYSSLVRDDVSKVETQLKIQKMLSRYFDITFSTFLEGVAHLKGFPPGSAEYDGFHKKITERFGDIDMFPLLNTINSQANDAKHPRNEQGGQIDNLTGQSDECGEISNEAQGRATSQERDVAEALSQYITTREGGSMPASLISGFYKQNQLYKNVIMKDGRKCNEFCAAYPLLFELEETPSSKNIKVRLVWPHEQSVTDVIARSPDTARHLCIVVSSLTEVEQAMTSQEFQSRIEDITGDRLPGCPQKLKHAFIVGCPDVGSLSKLLHVFAGRAAHFEVKWPHKLKSMFDIFKKKRLAELLVVKIYDIDGQQPKDLGKEISEAADVVLAVDPFIAANHNCAFIGCKSESDCARVLSAFSSRAAPYRKSK